MPYFPVGLILIKATGNKCIQSITSNNCLKMQRLYFHNYASLDCFQRNFLVVYKTIMTLSLASQTHHWFCCLIDSSPNFRSAANILVLLFYSLAIWNQYFLASLTSLYTVNGHLYIWKRTTGNKYLMLCPFSNYENMESF